MTVDSLGNLNMHDSEILELVMDRVDTEADKIIILLNYIEDYESMQVSRKRLVFHGCYRAVLDMNFGVLAPESIRSGYEVENSSLISDLKARLAKVGITANNNLMHFRIETNSTGSVINIVAEGVELLDEVAVSTSEEQNQSERSKI